LDVSPEAKYGFQGGDRSVLKMLLAALRSRKANRGFTLIELLVVVAIIGLLAAFAVPKLFEAINKAKGAQGTADLKTISAALERYYFDNNHYPTSTDGVAFKTDLAPYLKKTATFTNGYTKGFFYGTNTDGTAGYVLIDPANTTAAVTSVCGATGVNWTPTSSTTLASGTDPAMATKVSTGLAKTNIDGCAAPTGTSLDTN
jgi:type II secretion system protein G